MSIKYFLSVTIDNIEFAKDFQYFITVQYQNQKKRTDLSVNARNPIFTCNTFLFPLENPNVQVSGIVTFTACVVLEESLGSDQKGMSKILGEVDVDLYPLSLQASEGFTTPIRQQLRFIRSKDGKEVPVGRFIAMLKIINESADDSNKDSPKPVKFNSESFVNFPEYDPSFNFSWRVLAHIRAASNIPSDSDSRGLTPKAYVELGWSEKEGYPNKQSSFRTNIIQSSDPFWNNCFLINNPSDKKDKKQRRGYVCLVLKDQNSIEDIMMFNIPIQSMTPFVFYNLNIQQKSKRCNMIISLVLQAPTDPGQTLYDILISDVIISPLPKKVSQMSLLLNTQSDIPRVEFYKFDKTKQSITRLIQFDEQTKSKVFSYSISQVAKLPLKSASQTQPTFVFTIPERMINKQLVICLLIQSQDDPDINRLPNNLVAVTESLSADLNGLLVKKSKKKLILNFNILKKAGNPLLLTKQCKMTLTTHSLQERQKERQKQKTIERQNSQVFKRSKLSTPHKEQPYMQKSMGLFLKEEQNIVNKSSTNNQIINRLLKQLDEKNEAVKVAASEVIDLRKQMKLMQSENNILRKQAIQGEEQIRELVSRQISDLDNNQLRDKIIKLAGMYKNQRGKVKELQNTIKTLEPQVSGNMQLQSALGSLQNKLKVMTMKQGEAKKELDRIALYKDTIKKQEKVILKLEKVITDSMKDIKKVREDRLELEQYRKNGVSNGRNSSNGQIQRLQKLVAQLQQQNIQKYNSEPIDQSELQFRLYKAQQRSAALQQQISNTSKKYAKQMARLKLVIAEKQALLDGFTLDID